MSQATATATITSKVCTRCCIDKPLSAFTFHPNGRGQRRSWCKECTAAYHRQVRSESEARREYDKAQKKAYDEALSVLRERYRSEFDAIYDDKKRQAGLR